MCVTLSCTTGLLQTMAAWIARGKTRSDDRYDGFNEGCSSRVNKVFLFPSTLPGSGDTWLKPATGCVKVLSTQLFLLNFSYYRLGYSKRQDGQEADLPVSWRSFSLTLKR